MYRTASSPLSSTIIPQPVLTSGSSLASMTLPSTSAFLPSPFARSNRLQDRTRMSLRVSWEAGLKWVEHVGCVQLVCDGVGLYCASSPHYSGICPTLTEPSQRGFPSFASATMPHSNSKFHYSLNHRDNPCLLGCVPNLFCCAFHILIHCYDAANILFHFLVCFVFFLFKLF